MVGVRIGFTPKSGGDVLCNALATQLSPPHVAKDFLEVAKQAVSREEIEIEKG